ncbi:porin, partial [Erwinia amylovora]|uniref:porin n=1 Tax=Erwinia amylovora TaxID=552 RepID=UPI00200B8CA0
ATVLGEDFTGYGQWQYQCQLNKSEGSDAVSGDKPRLGFAGLKYGKWGSIDYCRNYGVVYDVLAWTDMMPKFGGDACNTDGFLAGRATGLA